MRFSHAILAALSILAVWQSVVWIAAPPPFILPDVPRVFAALWNNRALIGTHTVITLTEIALGLIFGGSFGIISAILLAQSSRARILVRPLLVFTQALPVFALAPILNLWMGFGMTPKVVMATLIIYFPITSAFFDGLMRTPVGYLDLAKTMQAKSGQILWRIRIPAALPSLASGFKLAAVYAPIGVVIGEWVGSANGLGYLMLLANGRAKIDLMFAAMLMLGVISVTLYLIADALARRQMR